MRGVVAAFLCAAVTPTTPSCSYVIGAEGRALEWITPPPGADSRILVSEPVPSETQVLPLPGALVIVQPFLAGDIPENLPAAWRDATLPDSARADSTGAFAWNETTVPHRRPVRIRVEREGYRPAEVEVMYGREDGPRQGHRFRVTALLVRE